MHAQEKKTQRYKKSGLMHVYIQSYTHAHTHSLSLSFSFFFAGLPYVLIIQSYHLLATSICVKIQVYDPPFESGGTYFPSIFNRIMAG